MFKSTMLIPHEKLKNWIKVFWFLEGNGNGELFNLIHELNQIQPVLTLQTLLGLF
jgi:hypothetical protein